MSRSSLTRDPTAALLRPDGRVQERSGIRLRAVVLALLLVPVNVASIVCGNWVNGDGALALFLGLITGSGTASFLLAVLSTVSGVKL